MVLDIGELKLLVKNRSVVAQSVFRHAGDLMFRFSVEVLVIVEVLDDQTGCLSRLPW
jgi:hypothetical protein